MNPADYLFEFTCRVISLLLVHRLLQYLLSPKLPLSCRLQFLQTSNIFLFSSRQMESIYPIILHSYLMLLISPQFTSHHMVSIIFSAVAHFLSNLTVAIFIQTRMGQMPNIQIRRMSKDQMCVRIMLESLSVMGHTAFPWLTSLLVQ